MILLAVWRLKDNAYGVAIRKKIEQTANKNYTYGTLYGILEQLVKKNMLKRIKGDPIPERGGRAKMFYHLTPHGIDALKHALELHRSVWSGITEVTFDTN